MEKAAYSIKEVSQVLGIAEGTVRRMVRDGEIPSFRISQRRIIIPVASFDEWLKEKARIDND